jgi:BirA family biotin operon repressor/biotin-[acetyl-CoA-carboxylase] ligase
MDTAFELNSPNDRTVILSLQQKQGRGRLGRPWWSDPGGLYTSVVLTEHDADIPYSMLASYAVLNAVREYGAEAELKWVNDVLCGGGRKIAGVLAEERGSMCVIGMGVNVNNRDFPPELEGCATSLYLETGTDVHIAEFLCSVLQHLFPILDSAHSGALEELLALWEQEADMYGRSVRLSGPYGKLCGTVRGVNRSNGALRLEVGGTLREVYEGSLFFLD